MSLRKKRRRTNGRMCCVVFLRNASVFLNYVIVISALVASIMMIYVYLAENDREVENIQNVFYTFRGAVIIFMILAILVCFTWNFLPLLDINIHQRLHQLG